MGNEDKVGSMGGRLEQRQFEALWREHRGIVAKVAGVYTRGVEEQRDLMQEIGVQVWRAFPAYDAGKAKFSTWLYRIALNVAISQLRRLNAQPTQVEPLDEGHLATLAAAPYEEPDERLVALHGFIDSLDALNRALILLYLEDKSYAEIAEVLGISTTNVATKINRIKHTLRGQMTVAATTGA